MTLAPNDTPTISGVRSLIRADPAVNGACRWPDPQPLPRKKRCLIAINLHQPTFLEESGVTHDEMRFLLDLALDLERAEYSDTGS